MARTQSADYEQRRAAIVDHAAALFAGTGFRGVSVSDVAAACAMSKSLLYHYFPSKEDVLYAVMSSHVDALVAEVGRVVASKEPPAAQLATLIHGFLRLYVDAAAKQKVLLNDLAHLPEDRRATIVGKQRIIIDAVQALLVAQHPALAADRVRARAFTMLLFGMLNWTMTWFDAAGPLSADALADMIVARASAPL